MKLLGSALMMGTCKFCSTRNLNEETSRKNIAMLPNLLKPGMMIFVFQAIAVTNPHSLHAQIGSEMAVERHLNDGEEFRSSLAQLLAQGRLLFNANWTEQEGGG